MTAGERGRIYADELAAALRALPFDTITLVGDLLADACRNGAQVFIIGNGGSAATASHMACDLAKTTLGKVADLPARRLRALALTDNVPLITAWANDVSYDSVFSEQLRGLARAGDVLIAISASGNSPNILRCLEAARELGVKTVGFLGFGGGAALALCDLAVVVDSRDYGIVEDAHSALNHMLTASLKAVVGP
ncbi:MAG: SIS domain-containing protein [Fimbriimonas ginsengisoli]|uniref:SIS domain-containing protein n=1 Tax=Fimbriimonas ginsengisoli TaxID=1005039 RepID=A0A931LUZ4_FIMGI|nr:SIS domain-containing protein [Fimbriimonas ginsengisoli]